MLVQRLCQAALLALFTAACVAVGAPDAQAAVLTPGDVVIWGLLAGYAVPALAFVAAPRLRRADLARAAFMLLAAFTLFRFGLTQTSFMLCATTAGGALAILAPAQIETLRRRTRARLSVDARLAAPDRRQPATLRAMAFEVSTASKM